MAQLYRTRDGDMVDWICWRHYDGRQSGAVEAVYAANRDLAEHGPRLPAGIEIVLPDLPEPGPLPVVRIWS